MLQRRSLLAGQHGPALTMSRKPVLLDGSQLLREFAKAHHSDTHQSGSRGVPSMDEQALRGLITRVKGGKLSRRAFVHKMVALGLTAPMASQMLDYCGVAQAQTAFQYKPTKRGGGGALKVLWWQGATLLNPHFAVGTKDQEGSRIFYEPLAGWDEDGNLVAALAAE